MAGVFKTVTFMVLVFAAVVVFAEDYDVGDDTEWTRPMDPEFYTTWATGKTFRVGDELEFDFAAGRHDVAVVTQDAFENCEKEKPISHMTVPPVKIMLNTTGPQYFICTVGDHCRFGQKLSINVVGAGASGGATPGAGGGANPAPGSTPSAGGTTPPTAGGTTTPSGSSGTTTPAGNAASSLGGATFLVAFVSAVVALF
ncbi:Phytocyanin domain [Arabidopsis thaliana x Arabidopsis arenosa]|uniref:Phytocyanin domain n=1 Tax=Arabidopsis thaliana x Arabidopsis arenosa TaxID=1240361 RepID=A0A8T1Z047_9BRAS|nr:Phytocyanin domain [Arabidopsis thaliana x Arabidopsis arenosa]